MKWLAGARDLRCLRGGTLMMFPFCGMQCNPSPCLHRIWRPPPTSYQLGVERIYFGGVLKCLPGPPHGGDPSPGVAHGRLFMPASVCSFFLPQLRMTPQMETPQMETLPG